MKKHTHENEDQGEGNILIITHYKLEENGKTSNETTINNSAFEKWVESLTLNGIMDLNDIRNIIVDISLEWCTPDQIFQEIINKNSYTAIDWKLFNPKKFKVNTNAYIKVRDFFNNKQILYEEETSSDSDLDENPFFLDSSEEEYTESD
ncbi:expressed protein [Dictyostelium purpureum]|uniref:Expressed protein n=1 Tax=Dictyostelium purpureum TaxID=5786 RepID=F1A683_DICPU|nr:uncharacterized protein DICPUDRAFT_100171 [Dictyostelium purpureum]EGC28297.1 expressed protein [Dictyostelium purpureum]|eukprot:XP_003295177.1 expressed protein [Dictyostelium purpureum]